MKTFLQLFLGLAFIKSRIAFIQDLKNAPYYFTLIKSSVFQLKWNGNNYFIKNAEIKQRVSLGIMLLAFFIGFSASAQTLTVSSGQIITITSDTYYASLIVKNGGTLIVNSPATLTIGPAGTPAGTQVVDFQNGSTVLVNAGASLVVNGLMNNSNNSSGITFNGAVTVNGNVTAGNGSAIVGSGTLTSTGTILNSGTIFGGTASCGTGPCNGNNLCGRTATASTSTSSICTSGSVTLTATISSGTGATYQWQSSSTGTGTFTNIAAATSSSSIVLCTSTTYYRVLVTVLGCITTSNVVVVTVYQSPTASAGGSQTTCSNGTATVSGASATNGTIAWTHNGLGSITSGASTTSPTYTPVVGDAGHTVTLTMTVSNSPCTNATATYSVNVSSCARTWTGATNTDWATSTNWSPSNVPTIIDNVVIPTSVVSGRMPVILTSINAKSISNSGTITFTSTGILNVNGNISNSGTVTTVSGSTVAFNGSSAQTITGVPTLYNVQIANTSGGVSLLSAITVKGALTLSSGVLTTNSNLTINFDNGGNIAYNLSDAGSISGSVSGRRDPIARTHYIAAPFSGVTSTQVDVTTPLFYNSYWKMYTKTFATQGWAAVTTTTTAMPLGTGFSLAMPSAAPLILTGTYNHSYSCTGTSYSNAAAAKYILVGNPYPTALDWNASSGWTKSNVANAVYCWNAATSTVSSYVGGVSTNGGTQYIPAMQSFMVTTTGIGGATSSVSIDNAARVNLQNPSFFRTGSSDETIRIKLTGATPDAWDDAVIRFNEMATTSFDNDWDAYKIISRGLNPMIYTTLGGDIYSINSVSGPDSLPVVDINVYLPKDGNYTLNIASSDLTIDYILVDKQLGKDNVLSNSGYVFSGSKTDSANRFQLKLRTAQTTGTMSANGTQELQIFSSTKGFVIKTDQFKDQQAEIELLDMTGNSVKVLSNTVLGTGVTYVPMDVFAGAYLVKVTVNGNVFTGIVSLVR